MVLVLYLFLNFVMCWIVVCTFVKDFGSGWICLRVYVYSVYSVLIFIEFLVFLNIYERYDLDLNASIGQKTKALCNYCGFVGSIVVVLFNSIMFLFKQSFQFYCPDHLANVSADTDIECYTSLSSAHQHCMLCIPYCVCCWSFRYMENIVHVRLR